MKRTRALKYLALCLVLVAILAIGVLSSLNNARALATSSTATSLSASSINIGGSVTDTATVSGAQITQIGAGTSGTAWTGTGAQNVAYPTGWQAGDLLLAQVMVESQTNPNPNPSGWTQLKYDDFSTDYTWIYYRLAVSGDTGMSITIGSTACKIAQIYDFRNVATSSFTEGGSTNTASSSSSTTISAPSVTTTGAGRLAVAFVWDVADNALSSFTGESGGTWASASTYPTSLGSGASVQLQTATMASAGTISGGSYSISQGSYWSVQDFALIPLVATPTGSVNFQVEPSGGSWTTYSTQTLASGIATSASYTPNAAGTWYFRANYAGDSNYAASASADSAEPLTVNSLSSNTNTQLSTSSVTLGGSSVTDTATVTPTNPVSNPVTFVSAGTPSNAAGPNGNPTPSYPSSLEANDLLILQVEARGTPSVTTVTPPTGFALLYGPDTTAATDYSGVTQWTYYKFATGTESGNAAVTISQPSGTDYGRGASIYAFRNVALASFTEGGGVNTANSGSYSPHSVTTSGANRLAVSLEAVAGDITLKVFSGATGGTWALSASNVYHGSSGDNHFASGLQTATISSAGTISGGSDSNSGYYWLVRSFALIPQSISPTGKVDFQVEAPGGSSWTTYSSQVSLTSGTATSVSFPPNAAGTWYFRANYAGDTNYAASASGNNAEPLTVAQATPSLVFSPSSYSVTLGGSATPSATVTGIGSTTPTGTLTFYYSSNGGTSWTQIGSTSPSLSGSGATASATAPVTYTPTSVSSNYKFGVTYSGDTNYAAISTQVPVALTVSQATATVGAAAFSPSSPITLSNSVTVSTSVNGPGGGVTTPTGNVQFKVSINGGSYSSFGSSTLSGSSASISYTPQTATSYKFEAVYQGDANYVSGTTGGASGTLTVNPAPIVNISPTSASMDIGQSLLFTASASGGTGTLSYQWYLDGSLTGTNSASYSYTSGTSHSVTCKVTDSASTPVTSPASNSGSVTVNSAPSISTQPSSATIDSGQSVTLSSTATGGTGSFSWQWYNHAGTQVSSGSGTGTSATHSFSAVDSGYYLVFTDTGVTSGASPAATATSNGASVTVNSALVATTATSDRSTADIGQNIGLSVPTPTTGTSPYTYEWKVSSDGGTTYNDIASGVTSQNPSVATTSFTAGTAYKFEVLIMDSATTHVTVTSNAVSVTVNSALVAPTASASPTTVDVGQTVHLTSTTVTTGSGGYTNAWQISSGGSYSPISGGTTANYDFTTIGTGSFTFKLIVTDSTGAQVTSAATSSVTVNSAPTVTIAPLGPFTLDVGQTQTFTANPAGGSGIYPATGYQWYVGGVSQGSTQNAKTFSYSPTSVGSPSITVTVTDSLGTTSAQSSAPSVTVNQLTISPSTGSNGGISPNTVQNVNYGATPSFTITPNTGYSILDVKVDGVSVLSSLVGNVYTFPAVSTTHTIAATFAANPVTLTLNPGAGGSIIANPSSGWHYGDVVTVTANPSTGYSFGSWGGALSGSTNPTTITMTGDKSVSASFTANNYALSLSVSPSSAGSIGKSPDQATYHYGDQVSLTANAAPGWTFDHWTGDVSGSSNPVTLTVDTAPSATAVFTQNQYSINPSAGDNGAISPDTLQTVTYGDTPRFTITPNPGYHTLDVQVDSVSVLTDMVDNVYTFPAVSADHSITATFAPDAINTRLTVAISPTTYDKNSPNPETITISGTLTDVSSNPLTGQTITLWCNDGHDWVQIDPTSTVTTITGGAYSYAWQDCPTTLPNGYYVIEARFAQNDPYQSSYADTNTTGNGNNLNVLPEYAIGALAALGACLAGFVVFKKRSGLSNLKLHI